MASSSFTGMSVLPSDDKPNMLPGWWEIRQCYLPSATSVRGGVWSFRFLQEAIMSVIILQLQYPSYWYCNDHYFTHVPSACKCLACEFHWLKAMNTGGRWWYQPHFKCYILLYHNIPMYRELSLYRSMLWDGCSYSLQYFYWVKMRTKIWANDRVSNRKHTKNTAPNILMTCDQRINKLFIPCAWPNHQSIRGYLTLDCWSM